jgi:asparagine synthase (glutamine-hydrolysing)
MCGICGSFSLAGFSGEDAAATVHIARLMERRGPDDEGFWTDSKYCALAFRRLSILDLSPAGHQPMTTPEGRYTIVYNGEIYNFRDLKKELQQKGICFRSTGDTEVVLQALATWGKPALNRFNGMFALALYDKSERSLLLARDHAGIKPLYYLLTSKGLVFGSQYDQLMSHPWANRLQVSAEALGLYLRLGYVPAPYAVLRDTYMLEPGTWIEINRDGQVNAGRFFDFPRFQEPDLSGEEAYEAVDQAVTRAVRRHLVSDVPVGTFLSGGIDSPLVASKATAASSRSLRAFTIGTNGDELDESSDARAYAQEIGADHIVEHVAPGTALEMLDDVVSACGEPFADYSIFPTMMIARMARRYVKVVLSGDGGDELFWGYPSRFVPVLKHAHKFGYPYSFRMAFWAMGRLLGNGNPDLRYQNIGNFYLVKHARIYENDLRSIFPELPDSAPEFGLFAYSGSERNKTAQWLRWNEFVAHLTMVLLKVDRASMHHSLEVRVPLLDREVIDVARRIDWRSCLHLEKRTGKLPLRYSLSRHVKHQTQAKRGFEVPMSSWLRGPLKAVFQEYVLDSKTMMGMPFDRESLSNMFAEHLSGRRDYARGLWTLVSLALWERKHYRNRRAPLKDGISRLQPSIAW